MWWEGIYPPPRKNTSISLKKVIKSPLGTLVPFGRKKIVSFHKRRLSYSSSPPPKIQLTRGKRWRVFNKFFTLNCLEMYISPPFSNRKKLSRHDSTLSHLQRRFAINQPDSKIDFLIKPAFVSARRATEGFPTVSSQCVPTCIRLPSRLKPFQSWGWGVDSHSL